MGEKTIYVVAKVFDRQGCLAYRCKTAREARCLPGTLESLRAEGVQIVILDSPELYSEYAPYQYVEDMKAFIDQVWALNRTVYFLSREQRLPAAVPWAFSSQTPV